MSVQKKRPGIKNAIDYDVSTRQAIGNNAVATKNYQRDAHRLMSGKLSMPPHDTYEFNLPFDWSADPYKDGNWCFQYHGLRWLNPCRHAAFEGDDSARDFWVETVLSWIRSNPPGEAASKWAWTNMVEAMRALELIYGLPIVPEQEREEVLGSIFQHGEWLSSDEHIVDGNHGLHQHQGLFVIGCLFQSDEWKRLAVRRLEEDFFKAFDCEGTNNEGSATYHLLNLKWWMLAWERLNLEDIPPPEGVVERLASAKRILNHMRRPDGRLEQIGDTDEVPISRIDERALDLDGHRPSDADTDILLSEGYFYSRSSWGREGRLPSDETFYSVRFGNTTSYHSHDDTGSVTFYSRGQQWITDSGRFNYQANDPVRKYVKSALAHNVLIPKGNNMFNREGAEVLRYDNQTDYIDLEIAIRNYEGSPYIRRIIYIREYEALMIIDDISGLSTNGAEQIWHFAPPVSVAHYRRNLLLRAGESAASMFSLDRTSTSRVHIDSKDEVVGVVSPKWNVAKQGAMVTKSSAAGATSLGMLVMSHPVSLRPRIKFESDRGKPRLVSVDTGIRRSNIELGSNSVTISPGTVEMNAYDGIFKLEKRVTELERKVGRSDDSKLPSPSGKNHKKY